MEKTIEMIQRFSDANGVSGFEDEVIALARDYIPSTYEVKEDHLRNLYMHKNKANANTTILIDAHSDEVGFIVQAIKPNGTIVFLPLGGWVANSLASSKVRIQNKEGVYISGIIAAKPPHFIHANEKKEMDISDMVIDVGACSKQEVEEVFKIGIGAPIVPDVTCTYDMQKDLFIGKAFDCRIGCSAVLETLKQLEQEEIQHNIVATLSAQEEVGERGMDLITKTIAPDIAICFEGCPADDTFQESWMIQSALRKGPMLRHFDRSMITNPHFQKFAFQVAEENGILYQESVRSGGGTNGAMLHVANQGTPTIIIGIPVRYIHSHHGIVTLEDFNRSVALAVAIVKTIQEEDIKAF